VDASAVAISNSSNKGALSIKTVSIYLKMKKLLILIKTLICSKAFLVIPFSVIRKQFGVLESAPMITNAPVEKHFQY
jgi:hypothetical protein